MAHSESNFWALFSLLLVIWSLHTAAAESGWSGCLDGQDVFATVKENSPKGEVVIKLLDDTTENSVHWNLFGKDAVWFYLDGRNIRLNTSAENILDRETLGPILMAELSCQEEDVVQIVYRILVEILNENDNSPMFPENAARTLSISELTPVNTVVFTIQAIDADNDKLIYSIDQTSPDAEYFRIDLPNSGEVILSRPLDYETKTLLSIHIYATEMNTAEHYNTSINITISVLDGDDQYPQFLPCILFYLDEKSQICTSPVYLVNITEGEENVALDFFPGPVRAVDGDGGLNSSISYAILSGDNDGHFSMDSKTGEVRQIKGVRNRLITPELHLRIMAYQDDDPRKFSVTTVLVRVLAVNQFHPKFSLAEYHGFVTVGKGQASLVNTYGNKALVLNVQDQDFNQGFNPMIYFTFSDTSNYTDIYQVTKGGLLLAKTNHLKPKQKHILEVTAIDQESGDAAFATVLVEVLPEGQMIPLSPLGEERLTGCTVGKALFLSMVFMALLGGMLFVFMWLRKKHKGRRDPLERGCVAQGKHPNVSLRWFQLASHRSAMPNMEEVPDIMEEYGNCNPSFSFPDNLEIRTIQDLPISQEPTPSADASETTLILSQHAYSPVILNNNTSTPTKTVSTSPISTPTVEEQSPTSLVQDEPLRENPSSPCDRSPEPCEAEPECSFGPFTGDDPEPSPSHDPDLQTTILDDIIDLVHSPSSTSTTACSHIQTAAIETDEPVRISHVKTPPHSPSLSSPFPRETGTPPPTPEHGLLKATLVHIDTSPIETPPGTPERRPETLNTEADQPSTSLDHSDLSESESGTGDNRNPSPDRKSSTDSGNKCGVGNKDDPGILGGEDADQDSDGELESDEEELLRVMARCNPILITFSK
ncbi:cadherin-related family member 5 isoform X1 [Nothobranchius furzeri]|nr:cadherin-related family member 5 isoform X1 [Nothobranchius furzeri]